MRISRYLKLTAMGISMLALGSFTPIASVQAAGPEAGRNGTVNNNAGLNPKMKAETQPGNTDWPHAAGTPGPNHRFSNPPLGQRPPGAGENKGIGASGATSGEVPGNQSGPANPDYPNSGTR